MKKDFFAYAAWGPNRSTLMRDVPRCKHCGAELVATWKAKND